MDSFNNSVDALQRLLSTGQSSHFGIKFVHSNKETLSLSTKEPDYDGDKEQLEEKQGEQTGEQQTTNRVRKEQDIESI